MRFTDTLARFGGEGQTLPNAFLGHAGMVWLFSGFLPNIAGRMPSAFFGFSLGCLSHACLMPDVQHVVGDMVLSGIWTAAVCHLLGCLRVPVGMAWHSGTHHRASGSDGDSPSDSPHGMGRCTGDGTRDTRTDGGWCVRFCPAAFSPFCSSGTDVQGIGWTWTGCRWTGWSLQGVCRNDAGMRTLPCVA